MGYSNSGPISRAASPSRWQKPAPSMTPPDRQFPSSKSMDVEALPLRARQDIRSAA